MEVTELRVVVPDEIAERLASEAAEVLTRHVPDVHGIRPLPAWVGAFHSGRSDLSEHHEEILKSELRHDR